jgi:hypothetical protein
MTDKMSDVIYAGYYTETKEKDWAHSPDLIQALKDNSDIFFGNTYIRQDSVADIDGLDDAIKYMESDDEKKKQDGKLDYFNFDERLNTLLNASRELQRIKGLK